MGILIFLSILSPWSCQVDGWITPEVGIIQLNNRIRKVAWVSKPSRYYNSIKSIIPLILLPSTSWITNRQAVFIQSKPPAIAEWLYGNDGPSFWWCSIVSFSEQQRRMKPVRNKFGSYIVLDLQFRTVLNRERYDKDANGNHKSKPQM